MENNYFSIYLDNVFKLANTLVIKLDYNIDSINDFLKFTHPGSFDEHDPRTWKYYLNVSGEYHVSNTEMRVISLDTMQEILFSKENLIEHRATAKAYRYGTRYYYELVSRYKDQETLILGILYPIDIDKAINAKEGQIIGYPKYLVEPNEYSLINDLQKWIDGYLFRWVNKSFSIAHDLYFMTVYSIMYSMLPQTILQYRHKACKTNEAHSFHVKQYLASHGQLDKYYEQLTLKQSLWLYRNLPQVKKNQGITDTFSNLTKNIMTVRNIPLAQYTGHHNVEEMPSEIYPVIQFQKEDISEIKSLEAVNPLSLNSMLLKEDPLARLNYTIRTYDQEEIKETIENSRSNTILTKTLESTLFDYAGSSPYNLEDILLHHWMYLSHLDIYKSFVQIDNPKTGEVISLDAKDSFILGFYLYCYTFGIELIELPTVIAPRVQRIPLVNSDEILKIVDQTLIPRSLAVEMLRNQPIIGEVTSIDNFNDLCMDIYKVANYQHGLTAFQENYMRRSYAQGMASRIYTDYVCDFGSGTTYENWFSSKNIDIEDFQLSSTYDTWIIILKKATGVDLNTANSLASVQKAMSSIMTTLSSYSVQFINNINESTIKVLENPVVRPGYFDSLLKQKIRLDDMVVDTLSCHGTMQQYIDFDINVIDIENVLKSVLNGKIDFEIVVQPIESSRSSRRTYRMEVGNINVTTMNIVNDNNEGVMLVPGVDLYLDLPESDRVKVADMYGFTGLY